MHARTSSRFAPRWQTHLCLSVFICGSTLTTSHHVSAQPANLPPAGAYVAEDSPNSNDDLIRNGGFETPNDAGDGPAHWQGVDNLCWFWTTDPGDPQRGRVLRIDTDVKQSQAYAWWVRRFVQGASLDEAPARQPTQAPKYDTVAGLDGGWFWSDYIPVKEGGAYRVYVDARGPASKVFIRGYSEKLPLSFGDESPAVQQVFRKARGEPERDANGRPIRYRLRYQYTTWFAVGGTDAWTTYTHRQPRHPNNNELTENVRYIRIMLYPYWPPGEYWYDNVRVVEVGEGE